MRVTEGPLLEIRDGFRLVRISLPELGGAIRARLQQGVIAIRGDRLRAFEISLGRLV